MKIGFIGTGTMGQPMLANLVKKGHSVVAYDVVETALAGAVTRGAARAGSAAEAAKASELVITMLPSSPHVEAAYLGTAGILEGIAKGRLCVDMSTIDPAASRRVSEAAKKRGVRFIDAPVSGGVPRAEDGTLAIMVGGDARDVEEARPVLACLGANVIHVGGVGSGEVAKICNNLIAGVAAVAVSEAFRIAEGFGVEPKILSEVISKSSGSTWVMEHMHPVPGLVAKAPANRDYAPGFTAAMMLKDLRLAQQAAGATATATPLGAAAASLYQMFVEGGAGVLDFSGIYRLIGKSDDQI